MATRGDGLARPRHPRRARLGSAKWGGGQHAHPRGPSRFGTAHTSLRGRLQRASQVSSWPFRSSTVVKERPARKERLTYLTPLSTFPFTRGQ